MTYHVTWQDNPLHIILILSLIILLFCGTGLVS